MHEECTFFVRGLLRRLSVPKEEHGEKKIQHAGGESSQAHKDEEDAPNLVRQGQIISFKTIMLFCALVGTRELFIRTPSYANFSEQRHLPRNVLDVGGRLPDGLLELLVDTLELLPREAQSVLGGLDFLGFAAGSKRKKELSFFIFIVATS